jgi:hypothetical protein
VLIKNAGLTGANNQMQREIYILQSLETGYPGRGMPENVTSPVGEVVGSIGRAGDLWQSGIS